jgi:hypothetical protein
MLAALPSMGQAAEPLTVRAEVRTPVCYVGQTVDLVVAVVAGRETPSITAPDVSGATLSHAGTDVLPVSVSAIGDMVSERSLYRARYHLVPHRAGELVVPPFTARLDGASGSSRPIRVQVRRVPDAGRTAEFLGGVGEFEVDAEADPPSVRVGQTIEYRVTIDGPGARGVSAAPDLARLARLTPGFRVERGTDIVSDEPPSHTFVYTLRPTRAGEAVLPPVRVSGFDPGSGRYQTRAGPGVSVRVVDVPAFDSSALRYGPASPPGRSRERLAVGLTALVVAGLSVTALVAVRLWSQGRSARAVRRHCQRVAEHLARADRPSEAGRLAGEGLIGYLRLACGRPPGALTPSETRDGVARVTGSDDLGRRAERLLALSDAARFGPEKNDGDFISEGRALFLALACEPPRPQTQ